MYILPDMIDLGFSSNKKPKWKSPEHRTFAQAACLCNPNINTRDKLIEAVEICQKVPQDRLATISFGQLRDEFGWLF